MGISTTKRIRDLSAKELKSLISLCIRNGARSFRFDGLEIEFGEQKKEVDLGAPLIQADPLLIEKEEQVDLLDMNEEELSLVDVDSPHLYEQEIVRRNLREKKELEDTGDTAA